jgi:hypothetical protein
MGSIALIAISLATMSWGRGIFLLISLPRYKRPDVPWSKVHPRAEANHYAILIRPNSLTGEGKLRLLSATRSFGLCAAIIVGGVVVNAIGNHTF